MIAASSVLTAPVASPAVLVAPKRLTRLPDVVATRRVAVVLDGVALHRSWRAIVYARRPMARAGTGAPLWSETEQKALAEAARRVEP